jgi:putative membrane protein
MSQGWKSFLQRWFITTLGVLVAAAIIRDVRSESFAALLTVSLLLGIFNAFLRPLLLLVALPLLILTLGLFTFVINALLFYSVATLVKGFYVAGFWAAFKASLVVSVVSLLANMMLGRDEARVSAGQPNPPLPDQSKKTGTGPVIDI